MSKLPGLTRSEIRKSGRWRWWYQKRGMGQKQLRFGDGSPVLTDGPSLEVTVEVALAYARAKEALEGPEQKSQNGAGSLGWLIESYFRAVKFRNELTERDQRSVLRRISEAHGHRPFAAMQTRHVEALRDEVGGSPGNKRVRYLRLVYKWAVKAGHARHNPAVDAEKIHIASEGHTAWTREDVFQFEAHHPIGSKARLAFALFLYTGQRRSDVVQWGPVNLRQGRIVYRQHKGRTQKIVRRSIPVVSPLSAILDATPLGATTWLETEYDKPFSINGFGAKMRQWCDEAGLEGLSAHGIRKATGNIAAERGCTAHQIMEILGVTLAVAEGYTRAADKVRLADQGFARAFEGGPKSE